MEKTDNKFEARQQHVVCGREACLEEGKAARVETGTLIAHRVVFGAVVLESTTPHHYTTTPFKKIEWKVGEGREALLKRELLAWYLHCWCLTPPLVVRTKIIKLGSMHVSTLSQAWFTEELN